MSDTTYVDGTTPIMADSLNDWNRLQYTILGDPANLAAITALMLATQAQQETGSATTVFVSPGRQQYHPSAAKFWVSLDSTGVIGTSYNVTSVTDAGVGIIAVTIATDFSSVNWAASLSVHDSFDVVTTQVTNIAAGSVSAGCWLSTDQSLNDPELWFVTGYGDQS